MKKIVLLLLCFAFPLLTFAAGYFQFSTTATLAYQKVISLRFDEARQFLRQMAKEEPDNLMALHIENYIDFFTVFLNENEPQFNRLVSNKQQRLDYIRKNGDRSSPYYLYTQAEIKLQWALSRLKFEQYFTAFTEVRSAYKLLKKNERKFPTFIANKKSLGILHAMIGTVPDNYKWGLKLLGGMEGTIQEGRKEIEAVLDYANQYDFIFEEETLFMYGMLLLHLENQQQEAWQLIRSSKLTPRQSPLACFVLANVAMHSGRNDEAIRLLEQRPSGSAYHPFPFLNYMLGICKLYRQDADADIPLLQFIARFKGQNYIKEAYQKVAWHHLLTGNKKGYHDWISKCLTEGAAIIGGDKHAAKEAASQRVPHPILLKARLLFDGGYYQKAKQLLATQSKNSFTEIQHLLEYTYRQGRIAHRLANFAKARIFYQQTIDTGKSSPYYYACNAALQLGLMMEKRMDFETAKVYFNLCLQMHPSDYRNSLHQKAKAGLNRLKDR